MCSAIFLSYYLFTSLYIKQHAYEINIKTLNENLKKNNPDFLEMRHFFATQKYSKIIKGESIYHITTYFLFLTNLSF